MAKRIRIIEGTWNCTSCDTKGILARHKKCPTCNNPRELTGKESEFDFGGTDAATGKSLREGVNDEKALEMANAGADWFCAYCGASNRGDQTACKHCSAERTGDAKALKEEADPGMPPPQPPRQQPPPPAKPPKKGLGKVGMVLIGIPVFCCFTTLVFGWWGSQTHDYTGQVTNTEWRRTVFQERFTAVTKQGWQDELKNQAPRMPVNGAGEVAGVENVRGCVSRQRGTRKVADGTERVCRTKSRKVACGTEEKCRTRDKGNGFKEEVCEDVTKYCSESYEDCDNETRYRNEPVYAQQCSYDTYEWKELGRKDAAGGDGEPPRWPELSVSAADRLRREEKYTVHVEYEDDGKKQNTYEPKTEQEYLGWKKGQQVSVKVDNFGEVKQVLPR
ncbi:hypothetical protein [Hyalangium rubrum]|uniref:RanBP2-type domain-containing protein n=1 Tax=Hyalangium rubrum TaxID=3103134 RepID=A0ABU5HGY9_9BACT|nr:hypothetical protein [Hyalangium sp. s54d21]MDY7232108.1 hypothetical protein [Hyalangium sp. s54d21]